MRTTTEVEREAVTMATGYEARVHNGILWLDASVPGWCDKIDLDQLAMADCFLCVLGQTFGEYGIGVVAAISDIQRDWGWSLSGSSRWAFNHGFYESNAIPRADERYELLRRAWVDSIRARRGE